MEVEREEVSPGDEDSSMTGTDHESSNVGAVFEKTEGHDRVCGELPFVKEEEANGDNAEY